MSNTILFLFFYFFIYLLGRGIFIFLCKLLKVPITKNSFIHSSHFFPLFGLFLIGEIKLLLNFFTSTNLYLIFFIIFFISYNFFFLLKKIENFYTQLIIATILGFSSNTIQFSYDAGLYHLNSQYWLNQSKIVIGLVNLHSRYGYSSFIEYINAPTWVLNNFLFQHFTNLTFIVAFLFFIHKCVFNKNFILFKISGISILVFGILDNFGISGGRNGYLDIEAVSKQDTPFAIVFTLLLIYVAYFFISTNIQNKNYLLLIIFLFLFSVQLRIFALSITPLILYLLIKNKDKLNIFSLIIPSIMGFFWIIKNLLISSCFFYPLDFTCVKNTWWFNESNSLTETEDLSAFHIAWKFSEENIFAWFSEWLAKEINYTVSVNFVSSFIIIILLQIFLTKNNKLSNVFLIGIPLYLFFSWSVSSPSIRMGLSIFLFTIFLSGIYRKDLNHFFNKKLLLNFLFFGTIVLMPRIENYKILIDNPFFINNMQPLEIEYYEPKDGFWGVRSSIGSECWVNLACVPDDVIINEKLFFGYRAFKKINK